MALLIGEILLFFYAEGWALWRWYRCLRFEGLQNPFQVFGWRGTEIVYKDCKEKAMAGLPGVNYVGGSRQLRRRVGAPTPLPWQGGGPRFCWGLLAGN